MSHIDAFPLHDGTESDPYPVTAIVHVPPRMLTRTRLAPLLAMTSQIALEVVIDEESGEPSVGIGIPSEVFDLALNSELAEIASLFRGLDDDNYHPRLLKVLKRSLN